MTPIPDTGAYRVESGQSMNKCRLNVPIVYGVDETYRPCLLTCAHLMTAYTLKNHVHLNKGLCSHYACRTEILLGSRSRLTFSGGPMTTIRDTCLRMFRSIMTVSYKFSDLFTYRKAFRTVNTSFAYEQILNFINFSFN